MLIEHIQIRTYIGITHIFQTQNYKLFALTDGEI